MDRQNTLMFVTFVAVVIVLLDDGVFAMSPSEKNTVKLKILEMFDHAYGSYMNNAYPADELMPLSCKGRYRGTQPSRGDIDDTLGNFTLSLIDSLDTLVVLGKIEEFDHAVRLVIRDARFDCDAVVSVFETNIRVLGGLLGGHVVAAYLKKKGKAMLWYNNELLEKAREVGERLLPAFNTTTGIPYPRINLLRGLADGIQANDRDTCTACAGTMILEFAALSRLTGDPKYEEKARKVMDYLWQQRHRTSDLMGLVINIHNGDWIRRESGVGAGIDSYYEYVLKSYILLGDETYLERFNTHYDAVMKYVSQGPMLVDVHMHKPLAASRNFMDALLAFWPGLQVLKGDIRPAIETHEMLYQVIQRHNFLPEAFTTDFRVHWSHHPLRPEFVESTYFLYKATGDDHYLDVGREVVDNLDRLARVECGFAAIKDVTTNRHEDQMDSYVLAETFKYLYLMFAEKEELVLNIDDYIFTTEAHLLPLSLSVHNSSSFPKIRAETYQKLQQRYNTEQTSSLDTNDDDSSYDDNDDDDDYMCPNLQVEAAGGQNFAYNLRSQMRNLVDRVSPRPRRTRQRLRAADFIAGNKEHLENLQQMGIRIVTMSDGRIQLLHTASEAATPDDAEDGMKFMQEMIELSKTQAPEAQHDPMYVQLVSPPHFGNIAYRAGPAQFGYDFKIFPPIMAKLAISSPFKACSPLTNPQTVAGKIALLERGECMFVDKARNLQKAGAVGGIVIDQTDGSTSETQTMFAMSGDGQSDITIPMVFLFKNEGYKVIKALTENNDMDVLLSKENKPVDSYCPQTRAVPEGPDGGSDIPQTNVDRTPDQTPTLNTNQHYQHMEEGDKIGLNEHYSFQSPSKKFTLQIHVIGERDTNVLSSSEGSENGKISQTVNEDELQMDAFPDGSKQLSFIVYKKDPKQKSKPDLNQIYVDLVQVLQEKTNFEQLSNQGDYLIAIARFLESAYFGLDRVDSTAQDLIEKLTEELKFSKDKTLISGESVPGFTTDHMDFSTAKTLHYASPEELFETSSDTRRSTTSQSSQYIRTEQADKSSNDFGAKVDEHGILTFSVETQTETKAVRSDKFRDASSLTESSMEETGSIEVTNQDGVVEIIERNVKGEVIRTTQSREGATSQVQDAQLPSKSQETQGQHASSDDEHSARNSDKDEL